MAEWNDTDAISISPQLRFRVDMQTDTGRSVSVTVMAIVAPVATAFVNAYMELS